jgi:uncharacterized protein YjbI with pentapeptide repeats
MDNSGLWMTGTLTASLEQAHVEDLNAEQAVLSFTALIGPKRIDRTSFRSADMNGMRISNVHFVQCCFDHANMSSSFFEGCSFEDCTFRSTNLNSSRIIGCRFRSGDLDGPSPFEKASISLATIGDRQAASVFENIIFQNTSLRNMQIVGVRFEGCQFLASPFDGSSILGGSFDRFDVSSGAVSGLRLKDTRFGELVLIPEKLFSIISLWNALSGASAVVLRDGPDGDRTVTLDEIARIMHSGLEALGQRGALFELVNASLFLSRFIHDTKDQPAAAEAGGSNLPATGSGMSGVPADDVALILQHLADAGGPPADLTLPASINGALEALLFDDAVSQPAVRTLRSFVDLASAEAFDPHTLAQLHLNFARAASAPAPDRFKLTILAPDVSFDDYQACARVSGIVAHLTAQAGLRVDRVLAREAGSFRESVLLSDIDARNGLVAFILLLGACADMSTVMGHFGPPTAFAAEAASKAVIAADFQAGPTDIDVTKKVVEVMTGDTVTTEQVTRYRALTKKDPVLADLHDVQPIQVSLDRATIGEIDPATALTLKKTLALGGSAPGASVQPVLPLSGSS